MLQREILLKVAFKDAFFIIIEIIGLYVPISDVYILYNKHQDVLSTTILYHCKKIPKYGSGTYLVYLPGSSP